ncbi:MAG: hypothetical protein IJH22_01850 [Firmicutes bacterium]|nr:hypothetical protein [Bacillota bacterium]
MDRKDRAKQFMPFAAVTGLNEALRQKEHEVESDYGIINRNVRYVPLEEKYAPEEEEEDS